MDLRTALFVAAVRGSYLFISRPLTSNPHPVLALDMRLNASHFNFVTRTLLKIALNCFAASRVPLAGEILLVEVLRLAPLA